MTASAADPKSFSTAIGRWAGVGPYYAMFPVDFAFQVIRDYTDEGESIIDPFAGRASSVYAASVQGRRGFGVEINPVGWVYAQAKLSPGNPEYVIRRIKQIMGYAMDEKNLNMDSLPEFFSWCYAGDVLKFLLSARQRLNWATSSTDATVMALILVYLHGKRDQSLSNQMRQGKAMSPEYSVRWWQENGMLPPAVDPVDFLVKRVEWRYAKGLPSLTASRVVMGDSTQVIRRLRVHDRSCSTQQYKLLFTSPPYYGVTNYYYDQWLRLWMLGSSSLPVYGESKWKRRFDNRIFYKELLSAVFGGCAPHMTPDAIIYVRTDAREFTLQTTLEVLQEAFPNKKVDIQLRPLAKKTQTALFGDSSAKPGEVDIIVTPA